MTPSGADLVVLAYSGGLDTTVTVHRLVQDRLREYAEQVREFGTVWPGAALAGAPSPANRTPG